MSSNFFLVILFVLTIFTRFYKIDWGNDYFFHPDENNMASAITSLKINDLNPHFFAYGQFPLYFVFFIKTFTNFVFNHRVESLSYADAVFGLRLFSGTFSCLTILVLWNLGKILFKQKKHQYLFTLLLIFSPGLIQFSHFGTTESFLIFIFSLILLFSVNFIKKEKISFLHLFLISLVSGIGIATKITSLIFTAPIFIILIFLFFKKKYKIYFLKRFFFFIFLMLFFACLFSPYNLISFQDFISSMKYETGVASGVIDVFYTRQFINTFPYLFQFQKVFPYAFGIPVFVFSVFGFFTTKYKKESFIILISAIIYFVYCGQLYVKWFRFMSPIFPVFIIFAVYFFQKIKNNILFCFLSFISVVPGMVFFNQIYSNLDLRVSADNWIRKNISVNQQILSEDKNVISLPLSSGDYTVVDFDFYELDNNPFLISDLYSKLYYSDFILVPSRRVYKNHPSNIYPQTSNYYKNLFNGNLGFEKIKTFYSNDSLFLDSNNAEETFTVFDHPKIEIYKKINKFTIDQYQQILKI